MMYRALSNEEMLRIIDSRRMQSPLINDLCRRLEKLEDMFVATNPEDGQCPVCDASLIFSVEEGIVNIQVK